MLLGILLTINVIVALALAGVVLLQRSEGGALGMGGGGGGMMTARGSADLLTRTTWILGGLFFALSLTLTILTARSTPRRSTSRARRSPRRPTPAPPRRSARRPRRSAIRSWRARRTLPPPRP
jgi:protein translocase SecG subunit